MREQAKRTLGKSIVGRGRHTRQSPGVPVCLRRCEGQCGLQGSQQGGKCEAWAQLRHGHSPAELGKDFGFHSDCEAIGGY